METEQDITIIFEFLDAFAPSVTGRASPLSDDIRTTIARFAKGELEGEERKAAAAAILHNNKAVEMLAEQIAAAAAA